MSLASWITQHPALSQHDRLALHRDRRIVLAIDASIDADPWTLDAGVLDGVSGSWIVFNTQARDQGLLPHLPKAFERDAHFTMQAFFDHLPSVPPMIVLISDGLFSWPKTAPCPVLWINTFLISPPSVPYAFEVALDDL